ncbi:UNVERIFIED_CONTAM: hypothetical protein FKN15_036400 [Acipenser sinensis]
MGEEIMEAKVMWYPDSKKNTQMDKFRSEVNRDFGLQLANYSELYQWSVENYPEFWAEVWRFCGIVCSRMYEEVVDRTKRISDIPEWFRGSQLNYAENLLKHKDQDKIALYAAREAKEEITKVTFRELRRDVALYAAAMRKMGVKTGDRVVGQWLFLADSWHFDLADKPSAHNYPACQAGICVALGARDLDREAEVLSQEARAGW